MTEAARPLIDLPDTRLAQAWQDAESLCIKCGFCLPACPTYRETGHEVSSPRGRLELMYRTAQGELDIGDIRHELWFCLGCMACETACPSGIRYHDMLEAARIDDAVDLRARNGAPLVKRFLLNRVLVRPRWLRAVAWAMWLLRHSGLRWLLGGRGLLRLLSKRLARLERRSPPIAAPRAWRPSARAWLAADGAAQGAPDSETARPVAMLSGCVMDAVFGRVHAATAKVLHANGYAVHVPERQVCCGALHHHAGEEADALTLARRNIEVFEALGEAPVVVNSAGCGAMLKDYGKLLAGDADWAERARRFSARVKDVCEFLAEQPLRPPTRAVPRKVAYDDPCHLLHAQKVGQAPRALLGQVPGLELVPLAEADWCCGSAGSYSLMQPEMSRRLLARKMGHIRASGAEVVATGNPGCLLQLGLGARDARLKVRIAHPVELLAEAYE
ncbi:MAG TPA: heterodisulfide reductase-related iron-sulfur binding cluster [bacterium]|nr:heterodisulfide reductase-related iron-sulfur binding cluster [bacterium]